MKTETAAARRRKQIMDALNEFPMSSRELEEYLKMYLKMNWNELHTNVEILRKLGAIEKGSDKRWYVKQ